MDKQKGKTLESQDGLEELYDPYKKADMVEAQKHRQAHYIRQIAKALKEGQSKKCSCCGFPVNAEPFPLGCSMIELSELGSGFPLYFVFSKIIFGILFLGILMVGMPCIIGNSKVKKADEWGVDKDSWIVEASLGNNGASGNIFPIWQCILHVLFMILIILIYHLSKRWFESKDQEFDIWSITARNYTIHAYGLGIDINESDVKEFFEQQGRLDGKPAKVVKVVFAYKIKEYIDKLRQLEEIGENLRMIEEYEKEGIESKAGCCKKTSVSKEEFLAQIEELTKDIKKYEDDLPSGVGRDLLIGQAFVTFETQADARAVDLKFHKQWTYRFWRSIIRGICCCFYNSKNAEKLNQKKIQARMAYEPNDIFWENLEVSARDRLLSTFKTSFFTLTAVTITFAVVYGMKVLSEENKEIRAVSVWPSIVIVIINFILARSTRISTSFERPHSLTAYNISVAAKLTFAMFFNSAVITLIVNYDWKNDWFVPGGLATDATYILISNAFLSPLLYYFSPMVLVHKLKMRKVEKATYISQHDANLLMENPPADMAQRSANLCKTILLTFCYAPIVPLGFFFSTLAVFFEYWMFKYLLLRRHSWPKKLSGDLARAMFNVIPWSVLLYSIMNFVFMYYLNPDESNLALAWMIIMICYTFFPFDVLTAHYCKKNVSIWETNYSEKYEDVALNFVEDYDKLNPITSGQGHKRFAELMLKKNIVNQDEFEEITQGIKDQQPIDGMRVYAKQRRNVHDLEKNNFTLGLSELDKLEKQNGKIKKQSAAGSDMASDMNVMNLDNPNSLDYIKKNDRNFNDTIINKDSSVEKNKNSSITLSNLSNQPAPLPYSYPQTQGNFIDNRNYQTSVNSSSVRPQYPQYHQYVAPPQYAQPVYYQQPNYAQRPQYPQIQNYGNPTSNIYHPAYNMKTYYNQRNFW